MHKGPTTVLHHRKKVEFDASEPTKNAKIAIKKYPVYSAPVPSHPKWFKPPIPIPIGPQDGLRDSSTETLKIAMHSRKAPQQQGWQWMNPR